MVHPNTLKNLRPCKKGETPNPGGQVRGARQLLGKKFCTDLLKHYHEYGAKAIHHVYLQDTVNYLRLVAHAGLPKEIDLTTNKSVLDELTPDQVSTLLSTLRLLDRVETRTGGEGEELPVSSEPIGVH